MPHERSQSAGRQQRSVVSTRQNTRGLDETRSAPAPCRACSKPYTLNRLSAHFQCAPRPIFKQGGAGLGRKAILALFLRYVQFEQTGYHAVMLSRLFVYFGQQFVAVHSMYERDVWRNIFHLVRLQMTDKMPLYVGRQSLVFGLQFLYAALAKYALALVISLLDECRRVEF